MNVYSCFLLLLQISSYLNIYTYIYVFVYLLVQNKQLCLYLYDILYVPAFFISGAVATPKSKEVFAFHTCLQSDVDLLWPFLQRNHDPSSQIDGILKISIKPLGNRQFW